MVLAAMLSTLAPGHAQSGVKKDGAGEVEILFANGSLVRLTVVQDKIDVSTLYGKLSMASVG